MFATAGPGDHVRLRRPQRRWMSGDVKAGAFGIVRDTHYGFFSSDVTIELADGTGEIRVPARDVRLTGGHGERGFSLARDWHRAKLFAGFLLAIPALIALARYFLVGGEPSGLVLPLLGGVADTFLALLAGRLAAS